MSLVGGAELCYSYDTLSRVSEKELRSGDELAGFKSGNDTYYYLKNLQGDIIGL